MEFIIRSLLALALVAPMASSAAETRDWLKAIRLPPGFSIQIFAEGLDDARSMALGEDGTVYVGTRSDKVYALRDADSDGRAEQVRTLASGLNSPNGVAMLGGDLYVAEISRILRFRNIAAQTVAAPKPEVVYDGYPSDKHHGWKYLRAGPDGKLYVPVGAPCNICLSDEEVFASITRLDPRGGKPELYARGLRNTVGFDWHPDSGELFISENGRDMMGDDVPPEELNHAPKSGLHFGYPFCHGGDIADPVYGVRRHCSDLTPPAWKFQAHVAPLGIRFYRGSQFPEQYRKQLFVAQHGSWNRSVPVGYRLVVVKFQGGRPVADEVFADGWLQSSGEVLGRPVDIVEMKDGALLVSDDRRGVIYRVTYRKP